MTESNMEEINIFFEPLNKKVRFFIVRPEFYKDYVKQHNGTINDELSSRFNSTIFSFKTGHILEIRKYSIQEEVALYESLEDLLFCRKVYTRVREDNGKLIYNIRCTKAEIDFLNEKYNGKRVDSLIDPDRYGVKLSNGQYLTIYTSGHGVLYNNLSDLQCLSPFGGDDIDYEDLVIERSVNVYISAQKHMNANLIDIEKLNSNIQFNDSTNIVYASNKVYEKVNYFVCLEYSTIADYEFIQENRKKNLLSDGIILIDNYENGLIVNKEN